MTFCQLPKETVGRVRAVLIEMLTNDDKEDEEDEEDEDDDIEDDDIENDDIENDDIKDETLVVIQ